MRVWRPDCSPTTQPPTDDLAGIAASLLDGLLHGSGDAVIGSNPASDNVVQTVRLLQMLGDLIER